jgi:hypothetical protein
VDSQDTVADVFFSLVDCIDDQCFELWFLGFGQGPECVEEIIAVECPDPFDVVLKTAVFGFVT